MKLAYRNIKYHIELKENIVNVIILENQRIYSKLVQELLSQCNGEEGKFVLSEDNKELKISKNMYLISDVFNIDFNQRKIINNIYANLENIAIDEKYYIKTNKIKSDIIKYIDDLIMEVDYSLAYKEDIEIKELFKLSNIKIEIYDKNLLEKIVDYIEILQKICNIKCIVFINLKTFLTPKELEQLYLHCNYNKMHIILLENIKKSKLKFEKIFILDKDLCEIY